ncbi:MAG: hypothetical protein GY898_30245, partial [Proteobacteria bacterium]|nr:hypothetical protein [Pseudomonadota bacterium]
MTPPEIRAMFDRGDVAVPDGPEEVAALAQRLGVVPGVVRAAMADADAGTPDLEVEVDADTFAAHHAGQPQGRGSSRRNRRRNSRRSRRRRSAGRDPRDVAAAAMAANPPSDGNDAFHAYPDAKALRRSLNRARRSVNKATARSLRRPWRSAAAAVDQLADFELQLAHAAAVEPERCLTTVWLTVHSLRVAVLAACTTRDRHHLREALTTTAAGLAALSTAHQEVAGHDEVADA